MSEGDHRDVSNFLIALRADGVDPRFLGAFLKGLNETGGNLSGPLNRVLDVIRSDAPTRDRALQVGEILAQELARDVRNLRSRL